MKDERNIRSMKAEQDTDGWWPEGRSTRRSRGRSVAESNDADVRRRLERAGGNRFPKSVPISVPISVPSSVPRSVPSSGHLAVSTRARRDEPVRSVATEGPQALRNGPEPPRAPKLDRSSWGDRLDRPLDSDWRNRRSSTRSNAGMGVIGDRSGLELSTGGDREGNQGRYRRM